MALASPPIGLGRTSTGRSIPLLFLIADTGGGHRAAAMAVAEALSTAHPGRFEPVLCDPLGGPGASRLLRLVTGLYGPSIRLAPWTWGAIYYASDSRPMMALLQSTILGLADRPVAMAVAEQQPALIVSFHPLVGKAAVKAARRAGSAGGGGRDGRWRRPIPVVTVVTDLVTPHTAWRYNKVDQIVVPSAAVRWRCHLDGISRDHCTEIGLPVGPSFDKGSLRAPERVELRSALGLSTGKFLVVLTGGGEGSGGMLRRAKALVETYTDVEVVAICGRNRRLEGRLRRVAASSGGRLVVKGFVDNMADWLRVADVVVSKAGPGTIAEATCCGAPLLLTSHVPGQEKGNTEFVVGAGAGRHIPGLNELIAEVGRLREEPDVVDSMRAASARISRPHAAAGIAELIAAAVDEVMGASAAETR